ncbi:hypothetical protein ABKA04_006397 [Annulohypoxylon sp. FPYF3050]
MSSDAAEMLSSTTRGVLAKVRQMVPPMLEKFHKGQLGRVAVIGGSQDYTGAPYFSAMASARLGCDMSPPSHHSSSSSDSDPAHISKQIIDLLPRLHVLVVGPGLGRDPLMQETCARVLAAARERKMPVVLDADALALVTKTPQLVHGWREVVLTPNVVEFGRLWKGLKDDDSEEAGADSPQKVEALSRMLGGVTIVQKGARDLISNGDTTLTVDVTGGLKRSGGQGDTLTGSIATMLAWRKAYLDKIWDHDGKLGEAETLGLAAFGGAAITRECSRLAFKKKGRSLQASDLTDEVYTAFLNLIGTAAEKQG